MIKTNWKIPFNRPCLAGDEMKHVAEIISGVTWCGDGAYTRKCHELLQHAVGAKKALLTTSCTHALEMSAILLNVQPGDEVIVPSFTFVSTPNAFVLRGARPVFSDVRSDTLNMDERQLESLITERTRAIVPVHYAGVGCEMDAIMDIARRRGIAVVEDNAHGLFGRYRDKPLGSFGVMATQSFHETKNFTCGEGGALLINDDSFTGRAEIIREKGTNRNRFFRGEVDKYTWVDVGSSYLPSDILAGFLYAQLTAADRIQARRKAIWNNYRDALSGWAEKSGVRLPVIPEHCDQAYHMFYMLFPGEPSRSRMIAHLKAKGILSVFHYLPLHLSDMGLRFGGKRGDCPVTEDVSDRLLRLPFFPDLTDDEQQEVCDSIMELVL